LTAPAVGYTINRERGVKQVAMEERKRLYPVLVPIAAFVLYFFIAADPINEGISLEPKWTAAIEGEALAEASKGQGFIGFKLGSSYGFISEDGALASSGMSAFRCAIGDGLSIDYPPQHEELLLKDASGKELARIPEQGYPYFEAGRLFVFSTDSTGIAEYDRNGVLRWRKEFPFVITAFDANASLAAVGLGDGGFFLVGPTGEEAFSFYPGGSDAEIIYGCAVSPDGRWLAIVSGLSPQRFLILTKVGATFRVARHGGFDGDYRRTVKVAFSEDSASLFYEKPTGLGITDLSSLTDKAIHIEGRLQTVIEAPWRGIYLMLTDDSGLWRLSGFKLSGDLVFSYSFPAYQASLSQKGPQIYLGIDSAMHRLDYKERAR